MGGNDKCRKHFASILFDVFILLILHILYLDYFCLASLSERFSFICYADEINMEVAKLS